MYDCPLEMNPNRRVVFPSGHDTFLFLFFFKKSACCSSRSFYTNTMYCSDIYSSQSLLLHQNSYHGVWCAKCSLHWATEPCHMCRETSGGATRSTVLLPGRGSDYIWSINTHWHSSEALWLSFLLPSFLLLSAFLSHWCMLTLWHLVTICPAICLWCHIFIHHARGCINNALNPSVHFRMHELTYEQYLTVCYCGGEN